MSAATAIMLVIVLYGVAGIVLAIVFVSYGVTRVPPAAVAVTWGARLLLLPGAFALWPLVLYRWLRSRHRS